MVALEWVRNNLANISTTGFKKAQHEFYRIFLLVASSLSHYPINQAVNQFGNTRCASLDLQRLRFAPTGNDTDMASKTPASSHPNEKMVCVNAAREISVSTHSQLVTPSDTVMSEPGNHSPPIRSPTVSLPSPRRHPFR